MATYNCFDVDCSVLVSDGYENSYTVFYNHEVINIFSYFAQYNLIIIICLLFLSFVLFNNRYKR